MQNTHTKYTNLGKAQDHLGNLPRQIPDVSHLITGTVCQFQKCFLPAPLRGKAQLPKIGWPRKCKFPKSQDWHSSTHKALNSRVLQTRCRGAGMLPNSILSQGETEGHPQSSVLLQIACSQALPSDQHSTETVLTVSPHLKHISVSSWDTDILIMKSKAFYCLFVQPV